MKENMKDKRKFMRFGVSLDMKYRTPHKAIEGLAQGRDISREGIGCYIGEKLPVGMKVQLEINIPGEIIPIFAQGEVVWFKKSDAAKGVNFNSGVKIIKMDSSDKNRLLIYAYNQWREKNRHPIKTKE